MKLYRKLLFPFVPLYYVVAWVRNILYDVGIKKSVAYDFPVICVGNLSVGGTGKTPMIEYLIDLLVKDYNVATLSRGYKRKTKGFQLATEHATAETLGDEPFQFYSKFKNKIHVAVDTNRVHGIETLKSIDDQLDVILLDDAFQHRKVKAGFNILLTTYTDIYTKDYVLPAGNLREPSSGANRAQIIVVTKCPSGLTPRDQALIIKDLNPKSYQAVFFSWVMYSDELQSFDSSIKIDDLKAFTLVTGIANANPLVNYLKGKQLVFEHLNYNDHYEFTLQDISELKKKELIVTTEKDFMRLQKYESLRGKLFYLPIQIAIEDSLRFDALIKKFVISKQ